jgi:predicted ester cyclase
MRIRNILAAALIATSASMPTALSRQTVQPAVAYTAFPAPEGRAVFEEPTAPVGSVAYNRWLGRMFNGVLFNTTDPTEQARVAARIVHEDYIQHNRLVEHGRRGLLAFMPHLFGAIPDARFIVHDVFATEERVVTRWTLVGTLTGDGFLGVAPKGQRIEFDGIDVWTIKDGQLHEHWDQFDWPRVFVQLGLTDLPRPFYGVAAQPYSR